MLRHPLANPLVLIQNVCFFFQGIPIQMVIIIGMVFLAMNMCCCAGVIYQKKRVRARESIVQQRIRGMSDAGLMSKEEEMELNTAYCIPTQAAQNPDQTQKNRYLKVSFEFL